MRRKPKQEESSHASTPPVAIASSLNPSSPSPLFLFIQMEGVIGDFCKLHYWKESTPSLWLRHQAIETLKSLSRRFQVVLFSRVSESRVSIVAQELRSRGVYFRAWFSGEDVGDPARVPPCMCSFEKVYRELDIPASEVSKCVLIIGACNLSHADIQERTAESVLYDRQVLGGAHFVTCVPLLSVPPADLPPTVLLVPNFVAQDDFECCSFVDINQVVDQLVEESHESFFRGSRLMRSQTVKKVSTDLYRPLATAYRKLHRRIDPVTLVPDSLNCGDISSPSVLYRRRGGGALEPVDDTSSSCRSTWTPRVRIHHYQKIISEHGIPHDVEKSFLDDVDDISSSSSLSCVAESRVSKENRERYSTKDVSGDAFSHFFLIMKCHFSDVYPPIRVENFSASTLIAVQKAKSSPARPDFNMVPVSPTSAVLGQYRSQSSSSGSAIENGNPSIQSGSTETFTDGLRYSRNVVPSLKLSRPLSIFDCDVSSPSSVVKRLIDEQSSHRRPIGTSSPSNALSEGGVRALQVVQVSDQVSSRIGSSGGKHSSTPPPEADRISGHDADFEQRFLSEDIFHPFSQLSISPTKGLVRLENDLEESGTESSSSDSDTESDSNLFESDTVDDSDRILSSFPFDIHQIPPQTYSDGTLNNRLSTGLIGMKLEDDPNESLSEFDTMDDEMTFTRSNSMRSSQDRMMPTDDQAQESGFSKGRVSASSLRRAAASQRFDVRSAEDTVSGAEKMSSAMMLRSNSSSSQSSEYSCSSSLQANESIRSDESESESVDSKNEIKELGSQGLVYSNGEWMDIERKKYHFIDRNYSISRSSDAEEDLFEADSDASAVIDAGSSSIPSFGNVSVAHMALPNALSSSTPRGFSDPTPSQTSSLSNTKTSVDMQAPSLPRGAPSKRKGLQSSSSKRRVVSKSSTSAVQPLPRKKTKKVSSSSKS